MRRLGMGWVWLVLVALGTLPQGLDAQVQGRTPQQADSARRAEADSVRARILRRMERLARAPGADSVLFVLDSIALEEGRGTRRGGAGNDSTLAALMGMRGYAVTEYEGGRADFGAVERVLVLQAGESSRARVNRDGMQVEADTSVTYNESTGLVRTVGSSTLTPESGDPMETAGLVYDLEGGRGSAFGAKTSYQQGGAKWLVSGDMPLAAADSSYMSHATFTSCELEEPHYHFETDQIKIIGGRVLVARPVRMYFADVPVMWFPFIAQSLSRGRASGILTPRFSVNDIVRNSTGYRRRLSNIGFYWAMSDYSDAIVSMDWFSDTFIALTGSFSYRFNRQFLDGSANVRRYWSRDGSTQFAIDTRHSWAYDERTQFRMSGRYTTDTDFVRDNSFNPAEVTQSIDSEGGANRRFDWGNLSLSANRRQHMTDDRVEWMLPSANLSLSTMTLFRAPENRAAFWNNMTVGGSAQFQRNTVDRLQTDTFNVSKLDTEAQNGSVRASLSLGRLSFSQSLEMQENTALGIPEALLVRGPGEEGENTTYLLTGANLRSVTDQTLRWSSSVSFQQQLIGSTTLTPNLSFSGNMYQSDTSQVAASFVSAPSRISLGASLKTDLYAFFPGFGSYERIRHKFSPSFSYDWSPEVVPTDLQKTVFQGQARALRRTSGLSVTLNQTFEAKRAQTDTAQAGAERAQASGSTARGAQQAQIVQLLGLRTSVIQYDFVEADTVGSFLAGFETTRLSNQISSDFLSGLSLSLDHDLFEDTQLEGGALDRSFKPHLSQVNLSFSLGSNSGIFRLLGLSGGQDDASDEVDEEALEEEGLQTAGTDESSVIPVAGSAAAPVRRGGGGAGDRRGWQASLSYALQRSRDPAAAASQMLNASVNLAPTDQWDLSWRTSYDLERGGFNDHTIRLTRDLHRWEAHFDFLQTATGNWQFRFEVSLSDNRDLKFDYQQRNLDAGRRDIF